MGWRLPPLLGTALGAYRGPPCVLPQVGINSAGVAMSATESFNNRKEAVAAGAAPCPRQVAGVWVSLPLPSGGASWASAMSYCAVQPAQHGACCVQGLPWSSRGRPAARTAPFYTGKLALAPAPVLARQTLTAPTRACGRTRRCRWCCRRPPAADTPRSCWAACLASMVLGSPLAACSWLTRGGGMGMGVGGWGLGAGLGGWGRRWDVLP